MAGKSGRTISATPESSIKKNIFSWEGILVLIFIVDLILCKSLSPNYTFANVLREMPKHLSEILLFFPMAYILLIGEIDISVGSIVCLAGTMGCIVANSGAPFIVVVLTILITGTVCGIINGVILTQFPELPSMIITLGTQIIYRGIAEIVLGEGGSISLSNTEGFKAIGGKIGIVPYIFFLVVILAVIFAFVSVKTTYGRSLYAIGSCRKTALYSGIRVNRIIISTYVLMGFFSGLAAMFLISCSYGVNTTTGKNFEMDAIAMAVFGGIATTGGKGRLVGGIISAFIIVCLRIGLGQINMNSQLILVIIGILLICAVLLPNIVARVKANKKKPA